MKSSLQNPIKFFEDYFEKVVYQDLKSFDNEKLEVLNNSHSDVIDAKNHLIRVLDSNGEYITYTFENFISLNLESEFQQSKALIEKTILSIGIKNSELSTYLFTLQSKIHWLIEHKSSKQFPFLKSFSLRLENEANKFSRNLEFQNRVYSFNLNIENRIEHITFLYDALTNSSPPFIEASKEAFINSFTGNIVEEQIRWKVIGRNKHTSKVSLFYFLNELMGIGLLPHSILPDLSKYVAYVFADSKGFPFINLKNSKSSPSSNPTRKKDIDSIITSLKLNLD